MVSPLTMPLVSKVSPVSGLRTSSGPEKKVPLVMRWNHESWKLVHLAMIVWSAAMVELTGISRQNVPSLFLLGGFCARSKGGLTKSCMMARVSFGGLGWSTEKDSGETQMVSPKLKLYMGSCSWFLCAAIFVSAEKMLKKTSSVGRKTRLVTMVLRSRMER